MSVFLAVAFYSLFLLFFLSFILPFSVSFFLFSSFLSLVFLVLPEILWHGDAHVFITDVRAHVRIQSVRYSKLLAARHVIVV